MPKSIAIATSTTMSPTRRGVTPRMRRLVHEALTLAIGCVAAAGIALALYLVAPAELRDGILTAFLGLDQPISSIPAHPPMRL
jgi:hypothetical protein